MYDELERTWKKVVGSSRGTMEAFVWRIVGKIRETFVRMAGVPSENVPNKSTEYKNLPPDMQRTCTEN